jgi:hypothetical protein
MSAVSVFASIRLSGESLGFVRMKYTALLSPTKPGRAHASLTLMLLFPAQALTEISKQKNRKEREKVFKGILLNLGTYT